MPLYDYVCEQCGKRFEVLTGIDRRDDVVCPDCGGGVKRVYEGACSFGSMKYIGGGKAEGCEACPHCAGCERHHG